VFVVYNFSPCFTILHTDEYSNLLIHYMLGGSRFWIVLRSSECDPERLLSAGSEVFKKGLSVLPLEPKTLLCGGHFSIIGIQHY